MGFSLTLSDIAKSTGLSSGLFAALQRLDELSSIATPARSLTAAISLERNTLDCTVPLNGRTSWAMYLVLHRTEGSGPTATVSSNRLTSVEAPFIAGIASLSAATVTGNIVGVRGGRSTALAVGNVADVAITGNVLLGRCTLPANRPFPAPLDSWLPLNTIV
ncbi:MAG: hypothetical protein QOI26_1523 [Pseudonocardiales bacterium]|nr:hypothetical protein [Pseudonocardiales bacterium]